MNRMTWPLIGVLLLSFAMALAATAEGENGAVSTLLYFPTEFHNEELEHLLLQYDDANDEVYVTSIATETAADLAALWQRIPAHYAGTPNGGPTVTALTTADAYAMTFDEFIITGAGWYDEYFDWYGNREPPEPSIADKLYAALDYALATHAVLGTVGAGAYPVLFADILPPWFIVPAYPCPDLITVITEKGYTPLQAEETPRADGSWPPLVTPEIYMGDVNSAKVVGSSIPNSWYPTVNGGGELLIEDYKQDYVDFTTSVANARYALMSDSPVRIKQMTCGQDGKVVVKNISDGPVDLTGWKLQSVDPDTNEVLYTFDFVDRTLQPGEEVVVFYGNMMWTSPDNYVYWSPDLVLAPGRGEVILVDSFGIARSVMACLGGAHGM